VLVVEDDLVIAHLIEHVLTRKGFAVTVAVDGQRAQQMLTQPPPAVVVLDVMLPFVGGFELIERFRGTPEWARVPILMLTSKANENYVVRAFGAGVSDYMTKPFRPEELAARTPPGIWLICDASAVGCQLWRFSFPHRRRPDSARRSFSSLRRTTTCRTATTPGERRRSSCEPTDWASALMPESRRPCASRNWITTSLWVCSAV
jgi:CheY-like chemotaxis protein